MTILAVLFDLDGTLLDRRATFRRHLVLQLARHPGTFPKEAAAAYVSRLLDLDENGAVDRGDLHRVAEAELGLAPGSAATLIEDFETHFPEECVALPHVRETLAELRRLGVELGLVTNGGSVIQRRKVRGLGLDAAFDVIVISEEFGCRKPDPRIFRHALSELGQPASAAAYVGDDPEADVVGARRAGLRAIWRRDDFWPEPEEADHVVDDLSEIPDWVRAQGP